MGSKTAGAAVSTLRGQGAVGEGCGGKTKKIVSSTVGYCGVVVVGCGRLALLLLMVRGWMTLSDGVGQEERKSVEPSQGHIFADCLESELSFFFDAPAIFDLPEK